MLGRRWSESIRGLERRAVVLGHEGDKRYEGSRGEIDRYNFKELKDVKIDKVNMWRLFYLIPVPVVY